jgi:hypothetical protein
MGACPGTAVVLGLPLSEDCHCLRTRNCHIRVEYECILFTANSRTGVKLLCIIAPISIETKAKEQTERGSEIRELEAWEIEQGASTRYLQCGKRNA